MTSSSLMSKIKERLVMMDLMTQMDKAKELTHFALTHHAISKEDKEDFTGWLASLKANQDTAARLRGGNLAGPPQVTISGVSGNIVQYNALNSPTTERSSRPWRSNSLTPPGTSTLHNLTPSPTEWTLYPQPKGRSHSLTFDRELPAAAGSEASISPALSASALDDKEIEDMIKNLPEGSGMRDVREWLKSLRLHKYTKILLELTYEELLQLSDEALEKRNVTLGARGKILKNIGLIRDRPNALRDLAKELADVSQSNDSEGLVRILRELEAIVLMPLQPYRPDMISVYSRHDSGFDSGLEEDNHIRGDVPGQIFDIFKTISTEIFVKEYTNHEVVTVFACLLEKCIKREAYNASQKQLISGWLQKLKTLWNPPHIKKATDYKKRPFRTTSESGCANGSLRRSYHRTNNHTSPTFGKNFNSGQAVNFMPAQMEKDEQVSSISYSPRRSMPEIKANHAMVSQHMKRNSYQEESQINLDGFNQHGYLGSYRNSFSGSSTIRRESNDSGYLMSLPESRRDSEVDSQFQYHPRTSQDLIRYGKPYSSCSPRRDSGSSEDYLTVQSAMLRGGRTAVNIGGGPSGPSSNSSSVCQGVTNPHQLGVIGSLLKNIPTGSMSSGCASDGSTDSLLEQDLHNLSLAVTQQALE